MSRAMPMSVVVRTREGQTSAGVAAIERSLSPPRPPRAVSTPGLGLTSTVSAARLSLDVSAATLRERTASCAAWAALWPTRTKASTPHMTLNWSALVQAVMTKTRPAMLLLSASEECPRATISSQMRDASTG